MIDISGHLHPVRQECGYEDKKAYILVNCCGYQKFISRDFARHRKNGRVDFQIIYITKGKGSFLFQAQLQPVSEGNIVIYRPGEEQDYTYHFVDNPEVYWIHFTGYGAAGLLETLGLSGLQTFSIGMSNTCIELFKKIINELQLKRPVFESLTSGLMLELAGTISRKREESMSAEDKQKSINLNKVIETMYTGYHLQWSLKDFARICNLSHYRFIHNFKAHTGLAPIAYLIRIRIEKAKELLLNSDLNISEISNIVGYDNPLFFSRLFKKEVGLSPIQYKKSINSHPLC